MPRVYANLDREFQGFTQGGVVFPDINPRVGYSGPTQELEVKFKDTASKHVRASRWAVEPDRNNLIVPQAAALGHANVNETKRHGERVFVNTITLPDVGGDRHKVVCKKVRQLKKDRTVLELEFETWRKVWFTIYPTDEVHVDMIPRLVEAVTDEFAKAQIQLVHVPAPAVLDLPHEIAISGEKDNINHAQNPFGKAMFGGNWPQLQRFPFHVMVVLFKQTGAYGASGLRYRVRPEVGRQDDNFVTTARADDGTWTVTMHPVGRYVPLDAYARQQVELAKGRNYAFHDAIRVLRCLIGNDPTVYDFSADKGQIADAWPDLTLRLAGPKLGVLSDWLNIGTAIELQLLIDLLDTSFAGSNYGNGIFMTTHDGDIARGQASVPRDAGEQARILIHELGHAFGLVPRPPLLEGVRIAGWAHGLQYDDANGGTGSHCRHNAELDGENIYRLGPGTPCIMYHAVNDRAEGFCARCLEYLRQRSLVYACTRNYLDWKTYGG